MPSVIVVTGASSGFGALASRALADAGHIVYAGMRATKGRNADKVEEAKAYAAAKKVDLRSVELDVVNDASVEAGINQIIKEAGHLDVVIHNAGHMSFGPTEAFTIEQIAQLYDINVLSTQRINRIALPHMRARRQGLLVWIGSTSTRGGTPPFLAPYFAAKSAMDSLAISYAAELTRWGIDTSIIVPGAFTKGTNHFLHAGAPATTSVTAEYFEGPYKGVDQEILAGLAKLEPADANVADVATAIVNVVNTPAGKRPFRVHIDPSNDGSEIVSAVGDRVRSELYRRIGLEDLLTVHTK
ncbi:hypothetical protein B7463_g6558, partial [Scytalidium lignicola]